MILENEICQAFTLLNRIGIYNERIGINLIKIKDINKLLDISLRYLDRKIKLDKLKNELIRDKKVNLIENVNRCYKYIDLLCDSKFDKIIFASLKKYNSLTQEQIISILKIDLNQYYFLRFKNIYKNKKSAKKIKRKKNKIIYQPSFEDSWKTNYSIHPIYTNPSKY